MTSSSLSPTLGTGILHLGLGAFHRAHQAPFTEDAIAASGGDWGIEAVAMRNPALSQALTAQGGRYALIERHGSGPKVRELSVIRRAHALPGNGAAVAARLSDPALHIVTVTVTEKGYGFDPATRTLDPDHPSIAPDLTQPQDPQGMVGVIVEGLARRRAAGGAGMTVMSCDNLTANGRLLSALVLEVASRRGGGLARWIEAECAFPESMVDRITPATTPETLALARAALGRADAAAVETEPFSQWVIEDRFAGPRPDWAAAGAQLVADVAPFEMMKLRLLNGAHSLIAYLGAVEGLTAVRDVMAVPAFRSLARAHMAAAARTLPRGAGLDPDGYADSLIKRFENPAIEHRCLQIAMDGSQKLPQRIFAPALARLEAGEDAPTFALATALWILHLAGPGGAVNDPLAPALRAAAGGAEAPARVGAVPGLGHGGLFDRPEWRAAVAAMLARVGREGAAGAARAIA